MAERDPGAARSLLEGAVPERLLNAYLRLVEVDGCPRDDVESQLGDAQIAQVLIDCGMAHHWPHPSRLMPATLDLALEGFLAEAERRLAEDCRQLLNGHRKLGEARREGRLEMPSAHLLDVITDREEITRLSYCLMNKARHDWMTLENTLQEEPIEEDSACPPLPALQGKVRCRSVYDRSYLRYPNALRNIEVSVEAGEQARIYPRVGMKMKLADETVAMIPLTSTGMGGVVVFHSPTVVSAWREYFELLWAKATPFGATGPLAAGAPIPTDEQRRILQLLLAGDVDAAIAAKLKISDHSVRRRIDRMKETLGVETRFALAAGAQKNGWLG